MSHDEPDLASENKEFANWTINLNDALKLDIDPSLQNNNIIDVLTNNKLFYSWKTQSIVVAQTKPSSENDWKKSPKLFSFKTPAPKYYNLCNQHSNSKNISIELTYEYNNKELTIFYKSQYYKHKNSLISKQTYHTSFKIDNSLLGIKDNKNNKTTNEVNNKKDNQTNKNEGDKKIGTITVVNESSSKTNGVYSNLVAPSVINSKEIIYEYDNYYQTLDGKSGTSLINALIKLQQQNAESTGGYNALFTTYKNAFVDKYYEKDNSLLDIYTEIPSGKDNVIYSFERKKVIINRKGLGETANILFLNLDLAKPNH
ncbi:hypothetical protein HLA87_00845 [Mycoplasma miroungigenitalium]|uniref:Uncharacterized protein n=1 Tax=Mycoplasma miroungigenitalium TaxID=754515 RepID=A0A6M4JAC2_9MOLU|nr:endonuclease [Mycoplasma miroungigenitalium]QJR43345.1 hypothetical protein HLA87_00845 [Mycoplasma miroungigenitalium]